MGEKTMFIANDRTKKAHRMAWKLSLLGWNKRSELMAVLPWAACYFSGEKDLNWLQTELPNHYRLILDNMPEGIQEDVLAVACGYVCTKFEL